MDIQQLAFLSGSAHRINGKINKEYREDLPRNEIMGHSTKNTAKLT
jgi:hypothetical protein